MNSKLFKLASLHWLYIAQFKDAWKALKLEPLVSLLTSAENVHKDYGSY